MASRGIAERLGNMGLQIALRGIVKFFYILLFLGGDPLGPPFACGTFYFRNYKGPRRDSRGMRSYYSSFSFFSFMGFPPNPHLPFGECGPRRKGLEYESFILNLKYILIRIVCNVLFPGGDPLGPPFACGSFCSQKA